MPKNKLSIYLIKDEYTKEEEILKDIKELEHYTTEVGVFYYKKSSSHSPSWVQNFFGQSLKTIAPKLKSQTVQGILLIKSKINKEDKIFVLAFGHGWHLLAPIVYEERFGLKTTLNVIDADCIRKISKKNMLMIPKDTSEQLSKVGVIEDFGIDIAQDLISSITGKVASTNIENFGEILTGKDSLSVTVKTNLVSIKKLLHQCYEKYLSDEYKKNFGWIDYIAEIKKDKQKIDALNKQLVENFKTTESEKIWMAVPEIIRWEEVRGFRYNNRTDLKEDIYIKGFLENFSDEQKENIDLNFLKKKQIHCISSADDNIMHSWTVYNCIYCEISENNQTFLLNNGKWYEIEKDFAKTINDNFKKFRDIDFDYSLPEYNHKNEADYNKKIAENNENFFCMDRKTIMYGGGHGKIEFCDIFTKDNEIIHIKRYGSSSVLSHLFLQGLVSGELFLSDPDFRKKVNEKLDNEFKIQNVETTPTANDYKIIFGVISESKKELEVPFFSKVSLKNVQKRLKAYNYKVYLLKIPSLKGEDQQPTLF